MPADDTKVERDDLETFRLPEQQVGTFEGEHRQKLPIEQISVFGFSPRTDIGFR